MHWQDRGIVLGVRRHGETSAVLQLLTEAHGRHAGLVRGGAGKRLRGILQPGNELQATWSGRLAEHLGTFAVELARSRSATLLDEPRGLACLSAACAVAELALPEREAHPPVFHGLLAVLDALAAESFPAEAYVKWELELLRELGFGLDLSACAVSGERDGLAYVSPRSGRAVGRSHAGGYAERLLPLPAFLAPAGNARGDSADVRAGLALTGFFLERHVFAPLGRDEPPARARFVAMLAALNTTSGIVTP